MTSVADEIARFDLTVPMAASPTPPSSWYLRPDILQREKESVLLRSWQPVCRVEQLAEQGAFVSGSFLDQPWVVTRDGSLRAFYNVCRHHAALVAQGEGCAAKLTCPYHGWTYDLDGRLRSAPRLGAVKEFQRELYGLRPIALEVWGPWVWLNFGPEPAPLLTQLEPLAGRVSLDGLRYVCTRSYDIECNWKVYVDNYLDGGYHVEVAHQALAAQLDLDAYKTSLEGSLVLQECGAASERLGDRAVYAWLYPNWMFNRYGPILDINWVIPLGPERCQTVFEYFFDSSCSQEFIETSLAASHQVQLEDVEICESVQKGLRSQGYDVGRYAPSLEIGEYSFHHWLARDLAQGPQT
ncbi:MAG: aromatic ring-hydroxylating dioxygenase subunit alpha [Candidatus Eremiobacteraeota bacterium]|nr:aromatic ring-hydroxylating dioxygenase subunit alpha [Candidatus Eremiobacteraeota bacterium]